MCAESINGKPVQQELSTEKTIPIKVNEASKDTVSVRTRELDFMQLGIKYYANFILPQKGNEAIEAELPTLEKERAAIKSELKRLKELASTTHGLKTRGFEETP